MTPFDDLIWNILMALRPNLLVTVYTNTLYYIFYIIIIIISSVHSIYVYFISLQLNLAPSHGKLRAESTLTFLSIQELI